jgi:hypothetical protein
LPNPGLNCSTQLFIKVYYQAFLDRVIDNDLMVHATERNQNVCIVEDPAKCLEMGAFLGDGLSWYSEAVKCVSRWVLRE